MTAGLLLLAGCGSGAPEQDGAGLSGVPDTVNADTSQPEEWETRDSTEWSMASMNADRPVTQVAVVDDIRAGRHEEYDRFVVEFRNDEIPGYHVAYLDEQPIECGSGEPVEVAGDAVLELRLEPVRGYDEETATSTVDHGPRAFDLAVLREGEISCDFEAVFTVVLGLEAQRAFRILELSDPARLVLDIHHSKQ